MAEAGVAITQERAAQVREEGHDAIIKPIRYRSLYTLFRRSRYLSTLVQLIRI